MQVEHANTFPDIKREDVKMIELSVVGSKEELSNICLICGICQSNTAKSVWKKLKLPVSIFAVLCIEQQQQQNEETAQYAILVKAGQQTV
uniref:Uncharacterized protein n=1 Tax=Glossina pallidipes TaxID=7398 RepID=A0A1B0AD60_GLOPL